MIEAQGAFALVWALHEQPMFHEHAAAVRSEPEATPALTQLSALARLYVRRDPGGRREVIETLLLRAAAGHLATVAVACFPRGEPVPGAPRYRQRADGAETLVLGARRVARRGAGLCVECGQPRRSTNSRDLCDPCGASARPRPREGAEAERSLWREALTVLGRSDGDGSRARGRRLRRRVSRA